MRVTTRGQVTIPLGVRRALGITPGTELEFLVEGDRLVVYKRVGAGRGAEVSQRLRAAPGWSGLSTDELLALTRESGR